jgi:hypothetical protein
MAPAVREATEQDVAAVAALSAELAERGREPAGFLLHAPGDA